MPFASLALLQVPPIMPINLTELLAVFMGISIVLIPVLGITARFALKPTVEALSRLFEGRGSDEAVSILERRMALMEQQIESIESNVHRLVEMGEFQHELHSPMADQAQLPPAGEGE
jgi:hypothetical protein